MVFLESKWCEEPFDLPLQLYSKKTKQSCHLHGFKKALETPQTKKAYCIFHRGTQQFQQNVHGAQESTGDVGVQICCIALLHFSVIVSWLAMASIWFSVFFF